MKVKYLLAECWKKIMVCVFNTDSSFNEISLVAILEKVLQSIYCFWLIWKNLIYHVLMF